MVKKGTDRRTTIACRLLLVAVVCLATACSEKRPGYVLTDKLMEDVLYDYHIARAMGEELAKSEPHMRLLYANAAFEKHGITEADFDTSMVWYARHPETLAEIYDRVEDRLKAQREVINRLMSLKNQQPGDTPAGDSIDVWPWVRTYRITGQPLDNRRTFTLASDSNFYDRDTLVWSLRLRLFEQLTDSAFAPLMALQVAYESDSVVWDYRRLVADSTYTIALQADTLGSIREVRGFIYCPSTGRDYGVGLRADHIALMRYHARDSLVLAEDTTAIDASIPTDSAAVSKAGDDGKNATTTATKRAVPRAKPNANDMMSGDKASTSSKKNSPKSTSKKKTSTNSSTKKKSTPSSSKKSSGTKTSTKKKTTTPRTVTREPAKTVTEDEGDKPLAD